MKKLKKIFCFAIFFIFLNGCQSVKDGLSGTKRTNSDEFLVQKKSPLVLPPKFLELPQPKDKNDDSNEKNIQSEEEIDIEKMLNIKTETVSETIKTNKTAEDFVLKNIKNN